MVGPQEEIHYILLVFQSKQTARMEMERFEIIPFGNCLCKFWLICVHNCVESAQQGNFQPEAAEHSEWHTGSPNQTEAPLKTGFMNLKGLKYCFFLCLFLCRPAVNQRGPPSQRMLHVLQASIFCVVFSWHLDLLLAFSQTTL